MKEKKFVKTHGLVCVILGIFTTLFLLPSAYASPPDSCLAYAYTGEEGYSFLLQSNSTVFGENMVVIHNCDFVEILSDDKFVQGSYTNFTIPMDNGINNYTIKGYQTDSLVFNENYENVESINIEMDFKEFFGVEEFEIVDYYRQNELNRYANIASIGTALVIWLLCVVFYWRLINHYIDRNYFEEVI